MSFTEFFEGEIPKAGKLASRLGMTDRPVRPSQAVLERVWRDGVDNAGCVIVRHAPTMPSNLARVKTNELPLPQIFCHATTDGMAHADKPFGDIAARLAWHRQLEGLEQKEYAEKAGLKRSAYSNWESGDYRLSLDGARALRKTYGLSLDFLFEGIDDALPMTLRAAWRDRP